MTDAPKRNIRFLPFIATTAVVILGAVVFALSDPNATSSRTPDGVAAIVGDEQITDAQLDRAVAQAETQLSLSGSPAPVGDDLRREIVQGMVMRIIYAAEAKDCGTPCRVISRDVDRELDRVISRNFSDDKADFAAFLTRSGMTRAEARSQIREALIGQALDEHYGGTRTRTLADARKYYRDNKKQFHIAAERRVSHILVEDEAEAKDLRLQLVGGVPFSDLAREHSLDAGSAPTGGALGDLDSGDYVDEFAAAAKELLFGEISEPVKTQFGWHLITVIDRPAHTTPFSKVSKDLVRYLRDQEVGERLNVWSAEVSQRWRPRLRFADPMHDPYNPAAVRAQQEADQQAREAATAPPGVVAP